jgi:hypothetical protein
MLNLKDLDLVLGWDIYHGWKQPNFFNDFYHDGTNVDAGSPNVTHMEF